MKVVDVKTLVKILAESQKRFLKETFFSWIFLKTYIIHVQTTLPDVVLLVLLCYTSRNVSESDLNPKSYAN